MSGLQRAELPGRQQLRSSQRDTLMRLSGALAVEGIPGGTRCLPSCKKPQEPLWSPIMERESPEKQPGCKGTAAPWSESLWGAGGSHHPCKHQITTPGCPALAVEDIYLTNINAARSQEQHQHPTANTNQIIYLTRLKLQKARKERC